MALTIPNTFTTATTIEAAKIQQNVDAIKSYLNGGIIPSDIDTSEGWVDIRHIMKGVYFSTNNSYEMVSGVYQGTPISELPVFNPGYAGKWLGQNVAGPVPNTGVSFYIEDDADVVFKFQISPRCLPLNAGVEGAAIEIRLDNTINNYTQCRIQKEDDPQVSTGLGNDMIGFYRRRFYQMETTFPVVSAGYHSIQLYYRGNVRAVPLKFETYSVEALYRT